MKTEKEYMEVIERFEPIIINLVRKYRKMIGMDEDDIKQELYIKIITTINSKEELLGEAVNPYITTCLKNLIMDLIRTTNRYNYDILYEDFIHVKNNDLVIRMPLREILDGLSTEEKRIALLYMDGLYQDEIGKIIGMSQQTISNRLKKIRIKIGNNI